MSINLHARPGLLLTMIVILFSACDKIVDKLPDESTLCSVQMITSPAQNPTEIGPTDTIRFSYDSHGDPVSIIRLETGTELNDYIFWYDHEHRLTDVIGTFGPGANEGDGFDTWQKLYYRNGRIILDTTFQFGTIHGTRPIPFLPMDSSFLIRQITDYAYDPEGRISRTRDTVPNGFVQINLYSYDNRGNLIKILESAYASQNIFPHDTVTFLYSGFDNKTNPNRTNPVWQFLDRNYSLNMQRPADKYNEVGLPTAFSGSSAPSSMLHPLPFAFLNLFPSTISYSCEYPGTPGGHHY